jgi:ligand-binding SRPBCC domain-containing protein
MPKTYTFKKAITIEKPLEQVFQFFSKAENLTKITSANLNFEILSPLPIKMEEGVLIDYRIKLYHIPFRWQTKITVWKPPFKFVDVQLKGPYKLWIHDHFFEESATGTRMSDYIEYQIPGGLFAPIIHQQKIRKDIENMFDFRKKIIDQIFLSREND